MIYRGDTVLRGYLTPGTTVTIQLITVEYVEDAYIERLIDTIDTTCQESTLSPGMYYFATEKITEEFEVLEMSYIMTDGVGKTYGGKIVLDGAALSAASDIASAMKGGWVKYADGTVDFKLEDGSVFKSMVMLNKAGDVDPLGAWGLVPKPDPSLVTG